MGQNQTGGTAAPATGPVAYLTGEYPKVSHTFIQREIAALRARDTEVIACTVRRPPPDAVVGAAQHAEARATYCILEQAARAPHRLVGAHLRRLAAAPRRWISALALAWRSRPPGARAALYQLFYFAEAGLLADHLAHRGAVHLHNHFGDASGTVTMLAAHLAAIPFSLTLHGPDVFFEPYRWRLDEKIARARFTVCISHFCRAQAMLFSDPAHWDRLHIVHCGIDPAEYGGAGDGPDPAPDAEADGGRLLFVGRLAAQKGVPVLIEAFRAVRAARPRAQLVLAGDGPGRDALAAQVRAAGLEEAVTFAGYRPPEAVAALMREADLFVLPSFAEGVPVVLMEAMASRLPVIAPRVAGVAELVRDGESGLVIPPGDSGILARAILTLLDDPERRARMGAAGRAAVAAGYDIATEAGRLHALFRGEADAGPPAA